MNVLKIGSSKYYCIDGTGSISSVTLSEVNFMKNPRIHVISNIDYHLKKIESRRFKKKFQNTFIPSIAFLEGNFHFHDKEKHRELAGNNKKLSEYPPLLVTPQFIFTRGKNSPIKICGIVSAKNEPIIAWFKNDGKIVENDQYKFGCEKEDNGNYVVSMTIDNYEYLENEKPIFKCSVTDSVGVNEVSFKIKFNKKYGTPTYTKMSQFFVKQLRDGTRNVFIKVFYYSEFQPFIAWSKNGKEIFYNNNGIHTIHNKKLKDTYDYQCDFEISNFTEKDFGIYYFYLITRYGYEVFTVKLSKKIK